MPLGLNLTFGPNLPRPKPKRLQRQERRRRKEERLQRQSEKIKDFTELLMRTNCDSKLYSIVKR